MSDKPEGKNNQSIQKPKPSQSGEGTWSVAFPSVDAAKKATEQTQQKFTEASKAARMLEQLRTTSSSHITLSGISSGSTQVNNALLDRIEAQSRALQKEKAVSEEREQTIKVQNDTISELKERLNFGFLLERIHEKAHHIILSNEEFRNKFLDKRPCQVFVMSIDIRQSTELMLNAKNPEEFSSFISVLCETMKKIVISNYGIIDKFTGDGILAFFPQFYSGEDAGYYVLKAADNCHKAFGRIYTEDRKFFTVISREAGLGIGIDYGEANIMQIAGGLTVIGYPVVYACRFASAPSGTTFLNQLACQSINEKFSKYCSFVEEEIDIKHKGRAVAQKIVRLDEYDPSLPPWIISQTATSAADIQ